MLSISGASAPRFSIRVDVRSRAVSGTAHEEPVDRHPSAVRPGRPAPQHLDPKGVGAIGEAGDPFHDAERAPRGEEIDDAEVELTTVLGRSQITLAELLNLKPGDVVPCDFSGKVTVLAEQVPVFRGSFGVSRGQQAVKVEERVRRPRGPLFDNAILKKA